MLSAGCFPDTICGAVVGMAHSPTDQASVQQAADAVSGPQALLLVCGGLLGDRGRHRLTVPSATISAVERNGLLNVDIKLSEQLGRQRLCAARRLSSASRQLCSTSLSLTVIPQPPPKCVYELRRSAIRRRLAVCQQRGFDDMNHSAHGWFRQ
jgi:hypothetical protein